MSAQARSDVKRLCRAGGEFWAGQASIKLADEVRRAGREELRCGWPIPAVRVRRRMEIGVGAGYR